MKRRRQRLAAALAAVCLSSPVTTWAAAIPSKGEEAPTRAADLARIQDVLARQEVARALADRGLPADEVQQRLARLSAEDLRSLAANVDEIQAAGEVPHYIWILLGVFLAVSILVMIF
jgi:hypothetical protein